MPALTVLALISYAKIIILRDIYHEIEKNTLLELSVFILEFYEIIFLRQKTLEIATNRDYNVNLVGIFKSLRF